MHRTDIDELWNYDDPAASESRFRAAMAETRDAAMRAELLTQIARAQGLQGRFDDAHAILDQASAATSLDMTRARLRISLERGRVFNSSGRRAEARPFFVEAYELGRAAGEDNLAVDAAHMLGIIEPDAESLAWHAQAMALAQSSPDARAQRWMGALYNNIGWAHHAAGRGAEALAAFERGLAWREENCRGPQDDAGIRIAKWCVARELRALGRVEEALARQRGLLAELDRAGEPAHIAPWMNHL